MKQLYKPEKSDLNKIPSYHQSLPLIITKNKKIQKNVMVALQLLFIDLAFFLQQVIPVRLHLM